jgi:hypothetical protein
MICIERVYFWLQYGTESGLRDRQLRGLPHPVLRVAGADLEPSNFSVSLAVTDRRCG